uniref:Uncharacterized protein n=1 Tax=Arundo donax TaxID=35708 RepID=A0A0A9BEZ9_ARUDO
MNKALLQICWQMKITQPEGCKDSILNIPRFTISNCLPTTYFFFVADNTAKGFQS